MHTVRVSEILKEKERLRLELINPDADLSLEISESDLNRPGLALTGFFDFFAHERVQIFGQGEWSYLFKLSENDMTEALDRLFEFSLRCIVFTHNNDPPEAFMKRADAARVPVVKTAHTTHNFIVLFSDYLDAKLAPRTTFHGVLVEVFGVGVLLSGKSGVGKSETALELVERGHRLVADDVVDIICLDETRLYGFVSEVIEHHMEIRGLGIISIKDLFGAGSVRKSKRIDLIIHLEDWNSDHDYDRLGLDDRSDVILGVEIPSLVIPVRPGRNVPILIETAAKNHRLKLMGYHSARVFNQRLINHMQKKSTENRE